MLNRTFALALTALLLVFATPAFSQGLAEYGTAASASSAATAKASSTIQNSIKGSTRAIENTLNHSQPGKTAAQPKVIEVGKAEESTANLETVMRANKQKLETAAGATAAMLHIGSVPGHSTIYIDGLAVAYAPAEVRIAAGKHTVELRHPAFFDWQKQLSLSDGETLRLEPKLTPDSRQLFISFDK